jgi:hypothetical protein
MSMEHHKIISFPTIGSLYWSVEHRPMKPILLQKSIERF